MKLNKSLMSKFINKVRSRCTLDERIEKFKEEFDELIEAYDDKNKINNPKEYADHLYEELADCLLVINSIYEMMDDKNKVIFWMHYKANRYLYDLDYIKRKNLS